ncbi:FAA hydrolase family protein [Kribbella capetownensis]|uniref:FAA hydrolase family protein n=1 Tax=Kribbella capetownensis TaxID=1572659 RepID=A0A4V2M8Z0_9ACTN|nr:fumarylacetoacetate hydrolase family protein [Kribbella capetownensis]TCC53362.1 FAA hydrolase family protein [Kribbella capetownensis]
MRVANLNGRLVVTAPAGAIDIHTASAGRFGPDPQGVYDVWPDFVEWARTGLAGHQPVPYDAAQLGAPVPRPRQVFGIGLNYREHADESRMDVPAEPTVFTKFPTSVTGPTAVVDLPASTVDWEAELVVVMGAVAHHVQATDAWSHVAGVTVGQDLSERTRQLLPPVPQFSLGKSFPGFAPLGPEVVTIDELPNPDDLEVGCSLNGEILQQGRTKDMIFDVPALIERLSAIVALQPGDIIFTGTPSGVGHARDPRRYLSPGDTLTTWVEGVGQLSNGFVQSPVT